MKKLFDKLKQVLFRVQVTGESCWPELVPSKSYLATNLLRPKIGDYIVFTNKYGEVFVKRVKYVNTDKINKSNESYFVEAIPSWAETSNNFGCVKKESIIGKLLYH